MRTRVGRSEEDLLRAMGVAAEAPSGLADHVKRLRPEQLRRLLAMTPGERLDRAFALLEVARDFGQAEPVQQR